MDKSLIQRLLSIEEPPVISGAGGFAGEKKGTEEKEKPLDTNQEEQNG